MKYPFKSKLTQFTRLQKALVLFDIVLILFLISWVLKPQTPPIVSTSLTEQPIALPNALTESNTTTEQLITLPNETTLPNEIAQPIVDETPPPPSWQEIKTKPGDSLATLFKNMGLSAQSLHTIMHNNPHAKALSRIKPNQTIQFLMHDTELEQLVLPLSKSQSLIVKRHEDRFETTIKNHKTYTKSETVTGTIHRSLYVTAKNTKIPYALIQQMADILAWQINFARDLREGDQFTIHYEVHYIKNERIRTGDILAVSYTNQGKLYQAIRHQTATGSLDYFTPEGKSVRKAFSRYPVQFSHISSSFNLARMHPILKRRRPHRGIDLAAPIGTPIRATSDGRITTIGYDNGYGNKIKIRHAGPYESLYAHLLKFKKGLKRGDFVNRGDIIGYVGQTGLADGPHCHYEFHINNQAHNPATVKLPEALSIPESELAAFKLHAGTEIAKLTEQATKHIT
ncbi:MAG: peptidoglycan DD-metalloendopeptidase family protein [Gammaproteobacteria bacterium]|nr:peptidoglycan DD-metalloendopeptidase family protein [Gammaproteobacteria bacterium]